MKFSIFKTAKSQQGQLCTAQLFDEATNSPSIIQLCNAIADEKDTNHRAELKKQLPAVTWQSYFPSRRVNAEAQPSGLFMLDVDHVDNPFKLWNDSFIAHRTDWGILFAGMTASRHGLRIVARCRPEFKTIAECQQWLATLAGIPFDAACKDWARCSFLVHSSYTYFCDYGALFESDPDPATIICNLPILGTLASRLRAVYLDGLLHSPSFQVSLEAPQASGKSFVRRMVDYELVTIKQHDEQQREIERQYDNKVRQFRLLNKKADKKDQDALQRPETMIRIVPATMSITKMLIRMSAAKGLHLFACEEEIDTVLKAFKRSISSYSDALRSAFDNSDYGQDYASENSFSGMVPLFYNVIFCGTPKAMCRFYPDVEDGLVSRVTFVTLPDQFGKKIPTWTSFSPQQKAVVDIALERLSQISIVGENIQPPHVMNMDFLNQRLDQWISVQQAVAVKLNDRTRDIFCRRAAVVGFRAGMLAHFLYGESNDPSIKDAVVTFAIWIANMMLNQHILRFNVEGTSNNTILAEKVFNALPNIFDRATLKKLLIANGYQTRPREVIYKWKLAHLIQSLPPTNESNTPPTAPTISTFRKTTT